jgi:glutamine amidotransferase
MCELLAMSARFPTNLHLSLDELARHGGDTGPHKDGWGVAYLDDGDALVVREPAAASASPWSPFLRQHDRPASTVIAHIRRATQGALRLRNTQPFVRELGGRAHIFAHNGMLPGVEADARFPTRRFRRIGDTDSEHAFAALMDRMAPIWDDAVPSLEARLDVFARFAADARSIGPSNFLYADGDAVFAHGHERRQNDGTIRAPGLHVLCRRCSASDDHVDLAAVSIDPAAEQEVALLASVPLSAEHWEPLAPGEVVVLREGRVVKRIAT